MKLKFKQITTYDQPCPKCGQDSSFISYSMRKIYMRCNICGLDGPKTKVPSDYISPLKITLPSFVQKMARKNWNSLWVFKQL